MSGALPRSTNFSLTSGGLSAEEQFPDLGTIARTAPLSFSQQQMWHVCQFQSGTVAYNQPVAWRLRGGVEVDALERSLNAVVGRHEALRTTFPLVDGIPVQAVHRNLPLTLRVVDHRVDFHDLKEKDKRQRVQEVLAEEARYEFNLGAELLLRAALLQTGDAESTLILTVHHIVCDGWSMGILIRELNAVYRALIANGQADLADLADVPLQYLDFAANQREQMQGQKLEQQIAYWKERLHNASATDIPADRERSSLPALRGAIQPFALPKDLTLAFKTLCAKQGAFLFMGLLAVFQLLLHRYTGETDIIVGAPVASRRRAKEQKAIGLFLNLITLRTDFTGDPTFRALLKQVCDVVMGAYQHQDLPFERVVEEVRPTRTPGRSALFQVTLDQVDPRWIALELEGVIAEWLPVDNGTSKFDVTLAWFDSPDGLRGWLEYNTDIFDDETISRLQGHYRALIEGVIADPDERVSRIPLLSDMERQQFSEWNSTEAAFPADTCIHNAFELQADRTPDAIAIETKSSQITYADLNRRANQLAHYLRRLNVDKESLVGVALERSADLWTALLAVLKAGGAYIPLDPGYPQERIAFMQRDSGVRVLLTHEKWASIFAKSETKVVCLDQIGEELAQEDGENPGISIPSTSPAYVIYTSGSTGQPKGVVGLHRGAMNRFSWMWSNYPFETGEVACAKTSVNFVDSVWESFGPLLAGIKTALIPDADVKSPSSLIEVLARHKVTRLVVVPSLLSALLDAEPEIGNRLPNLRHWVSSGESLSVNLVRQFREALPGRILLNLYGSSEVSADVTCFDTREMPAHGAVLIGKPIANTKAYVLDTNLKRVPIGISGQLCVGGAGLARGYLNRPEQSAAKFVSYPSGDASEPLYLTGDLARYRGDGNIELLGRIDNQVKIRGVRVEPEEIELAMCRHPGVAQAVVAAKDATQTDARLIAYVVPTENVTEMEIIPQLRQHLRETLPEQMVPSAFVVVNCLPLLPNGKIDRHALPEPDSGLSNQGVTTSQIYGPTEEKIRRVWQEALRVEQVGVHDNFFDVGGHSLLLAAVQNRLSREFNRDIKSVDLYRNPTISALAKCLDHNEVEQRPLHQAQERAKKQREMLQRRRTAATMRHK